MRRGDAGASGSRGSGVAAGAMIRDGASSLMQGIKNPIIRCGSQCKSKIGSPRLPVGVTGREVQAPLFLGNPMRHRPAGSLQGRLCSIGAVILPEVSLGAGRFFQKISGNLPSAWKRPERGAMMAHPLDGDAHRADGTLTHGLQPKTTAEFRGTRFTARVLPSTKPPSSNWCEGPDRALVVSSRRRRLAAGGRAAGQSLRTPQAEPRGPA